MDHSQSVKYLIICMHSFSKWQMIFCFLIVLLCSVTKQIWPGVWPCDPGCSNIVPVSCNVSFVACGCGCGLLVNVLSLRQNHILLLPCT